MRKEIKEYIVRIANTFNNNNPPKLRRCNNKLKALNQLGTLNNPI